MAAYWLPNPKLLRHFSSQMSREDGGELSLGNINQGIVDVCGPAPHNPQESATFSISSDTVRTMCRDGRKSDLFQMIYNVAGQEIPVNNFGYHEKEEQGPFPDHNGGIRKTVAVFQGIKRPSIEDGHDTKFFIYVTDQKYVYEYVPHMVCVAKRFEAPESAVFVIYVQFEDDNFEHGCIVNWEWVLSDERNPLLPNEYDVRYEKERWRDA